MKDCCGAAPGQVVADFDSAITLLAGWRSQNGATIVGHKLVENANRRA